MLIHAVNGKFGCIVASLGMTCRSRACSPPQHYWLGLPRRSDAFEAQLGVAGWQKGRNVEIIYRWGASDAERLARYAEELVRSAPDVFMVHGTPALIPLRKITTHHR